MTDHSIWVKLKTKSDGLKEHLEKIVGSKEGFSVQLPGENLACDLLIFELGEDIEKEFAGIQYGPFKDAVADAVIASLEPVQAAYEEIHQDKGYLDKVFKEGAEVAQKRAYKMLSKVYRKAGFVPRT